MVDIPHHRWHHELVAHGERRVWETAWKGRRAVTRLLRATHPQARPAPHLGPAIRDALFANGALPDVEDEGLRDALAGHAARARVLGADPRWPTILDAGVTRDGALYFTTSWVEGDALDTCLDRLDDAARRRLLGEVAGLLTDLHARGGVYGDLKASNLVWDARRGVGIIDLETLRTVKGAFDHVATPAATQNWAAPEQTRSRWTFQASDLYAWAVLAERAWPSGLPPMLAYAVRACKRDDPFARPTAASLQASLADPFLALRDARERVISLDTGADARSSAGDEPTDRTPRAGAEPMDRTPRGTVGEVPRKGAAPPVAVPSRGNVYDRVIGGLLVVLALLSVLVYRRLQTSDAPTSVELAPSTSVAPVTPVVPVAPVPPVADPSPAPTPASPTAPSDAPRRSKHAGPTEAGGATKAPAVRSVPKVHRPAAPPPAPVVNAPPPSAPPTAVVTRPRRDRSTSVHFDRHSAVLDADTMATVRAMAREMHARPGARLLVEGLSDGREADPALAYARAEAVRAELTELGIAPSRLHLTSSSVRDAEFDEDDRAANRRVDLFLHE